MQRDKELISRMASIHHFRWAASCLLVLTVSCFSLILPSRAEERPTTGLFNVFPHDVELRGTSDRLQLVASRQTDTGIHEELTGQASYRSLQADVAEVSPDGMVRAVRDGVASIEVSWQDNTQLVSIRVIDCSEPPVVDFSNEVQPIFASLGCSTGPCHGKQGGQNGFALSLLGFDDHFDFASVTQHARGRRVFPAAPGESLLLQKASAMLPHGGGERMPTDSPQYQTVFRWIEQGTPRKGTHASALTSITVAPRDLRLSAESSHRLVVIATYADGSTCDVTDLTAFSSNEPVIAAVNGKGIITAGPIPGEAAIMARYLGQITTARVLIPREEPVPAEFYAALPRQNEIDDRVWDKLQLLRLKPSPPADEATFLRRAYLDIIGRLPNGEEARSFLADTNPNKRRVLVDQLLDHPGYADHWANKWVDLLRPNPYRVGIKAVLNYDNWIRQAFRENWPYDRFVRELITAQGSTWHNGAATLYRDRRSPDEITTMVSQLFLGVRLECAKCHHHPFEVWGQEDFYSFAAFFARVGRKGTGLSPPISGGEEIVFTQDSGEVRHPLTGEVLPPRALAVEQPVGDVERPREALMDWMVSPDNPYFAKVIANRVWADMMGRGLVDPVDDIRATNPASNEPLLDTLANHLRDNEFDLKSLIRFIANSHVYGLSSEPNETNQGDHRNYSRYYRQRLRAEVLLDAINDITESHNDLEAMPAESRAAEIWTHRVPSLFLDTFGRPDANQDPPCERTSDTSVVQSLHLMNSPELHRKIVRDEGLADRLAKSPRTNAQLVEDLYQRVFSRMPTDEEAQYAQQWLDSNPDSRRAALEDLLWAMVNSAEFVFKN
jgi:hypothetical protein